MAHQFQRSTIRVVSNVFKASTPAFKPLPRIPIMNRATRGLFHGKHIMFGNNVAHSERKSRRTWMPNIQLHRYTSDILGKEFKLKLSTEAMRCIDKAGGFDRYMLHTREIYFGGPRSFGSDLKNQITTAYEQKKRVVATAQKEQKLLARLETAIARATKKVIQNAQQAETTATAATAAV